MARAPARADIGASIPHSPRLRRETVSPLDVAFRRTKRETVAVSDSDPLERAGRVLSQDEYESLSDKVDAQGAALRDMYEALRLLTDEVRRLRGGDLPGGSVARY